MHAGNNKQALLAIVDVLLHDPLASWKMSPSKDKRDTTRQEVSVASTSTEDLPSHDAACADARFVRRSVEDKLEGRDRGELRELAAMQDAESHSRVNSIQRVLQQEPACFAPCGFVGKASVFGIAAAVSQSWFVKCTCTLVAGHGPHSPMAYSYVTISKSTRKSACIQSARETCAACYLVQPLMNHSLYRSVTKNIRV